MSQKVSFHNAPRDAGPNAEKMIDDLQHRLREAEREARAAEREANRQRGLAVASKPVTAAQALAVVRLLGIAADELTPDWGEGNEDVARVVAEAVGRITGEDAESCLPGARGILRASWEERHG